MRAGRTGQAIFFMSKQGALMMYSKDDYDAQMLLFAIYEVNMTGDINDFYGDDEGDE